MNGAGGSPDRGVDQSGTAVGPDGYHSRMTELPAEIGPPAEHGHDVIHLGGQVAVVVPLEEYRRLRELERRALLTAQADAEERAALADYRAQQHAGNVTAIPQAELRQRLGLAAQ